MRQARPCASSGRIKRTARTPFRLLSTAARVSRGVSAIGATISFRLGPTRTRGLATRPWNRIEICPIDLCFPQLCQRAPVPYPFPVHRHRLFVRRALDGMPPTETGDESVSRRSASLRRIARATWGGVLPNPRARRSYL